jgi:cell division protein ZapA
METIHIDIAGRTYPLTVASEEAALLKRAGEMVAQQMESFRSQYGVEDRVDLLAMTALQFASVATTTPPSGAGAPQEVWPAEQRQEIEQLLARVQTALESRS